MILQVLLGFYRYRYLMSNLAGRLGNSIKTLPRASVENQNDLPVMHMPNT